MPVVQVAAVVAGAVVVLGVLVDVLSTTLTLGRGAGLMTRRLLGWTWRGMRRLPPGGRRSRLLSNAGPVLLVLTVVLWVGMTWVGWWLVFLGSGSVRPADGGAPAGAWDVAYYAGFALSTLGVGDFSADSALWRVMTDVAGFGGLVLVTLAITYLLAVVSAVVTRRALATQISVLGSSAGEVVTSGWTGMAFSPAFTQYLVGLVAPLATVVHQHSAYPVLHFFRSGSPQESAAVAVAVLDDALLLLLAAVDPAVAPDRVAIVPLRRTIGLYIATVGGVVTAEEGSGPPPPSVGALVQAGVPLRPASEREELLLAETGRRIRLQNLVREAAWAWPAPS